MQKFGLETTDARTYIKNNPDMDYRYRRYSICDGDNYIKMFIETPGWQPNDECKNDLMFNRNIIRCGRAECRNDGILVCCGVIYCCGKANNAQCMVCGKKYDDFICDGCHSFCLKYKILQFKSAYEYDKCETCNETKCRVCHDRNNCDRSKQLSKLANNYVFANNRMYKIIKKINNIIICRGGIFDINDGIVNNVKITDPRVTKEMIIDICPLAKGRPSQQEKYLDEILKSMFPNHSFIKTKPGWLNPDKEFNKYGKELEIDFLCASLPLAIEYNGIHHYKDFNNEPDKFARKLRNDAFKVKAMEELGFPFIVIPCYYIDKTNIYEFLSNKLDDLNIGYVKNDLMDKKLDNKRERVSVVYESKNDDNKQYVENNNSQGPTEEQIEQMGRHLEFTRLLELGL